MAWEQNISSRFLSAAIKAGVVTPQSIFPPIPIEVIEFVKKRGEFVGRSNIDLLTNPRTQRHQENSYAAYQTTDNVWDIIQSQTTPWYAVEYGDGYWMTIGLGNGLFGKTVDGYNWTIVTQPLPGASSMAWSQSLGIWCATFTTGEVATSPDGINWTLQVSAAANRWQKIVWGGPPGGEMFVCVADTGVGNRVQTSPDGINWTIRASAADNRWFGLDWGGPPGGELFVACSITGVGNRIQTSPDGINWTIRASATDDGFSEVVWGGSPGNERFVCVGPTGAGSRIQHSIDGINWIAGTTPVTGQWTGIEWTGSIFMVVSDTSGTSLSSFDGINWYSRNLPSPYRLRDLAWGKGRLLSVGFYIAPDVTPTAMISSDDFLTTIELARFVVPRGSVGIITSINQVANAQNIYDETEDPFTRLENWGQTWINDILGDISWHFRIERYYGYLPDRYLSNHIEQLPGVAWSELTDTDYLWFKTDTNHSSTLRAIVPGNFMIRMFARVPNPPDLRTLYQLQGRLFGFVQDAFSTSSRIAVQTK